MIVKVHVGKTNSIPNLDTKININLLGIEYKDKFISVDDFGSYIDYKDYNPDETYTDHHLFHADTFVYEVQYPFDIIQFGQYISGSFYLTVTNIKFDNDILHITVDLDT